MSWPLHRQALSLTLVHNLTSSKTKLGNRDREAFHDVVWKYHSVLLRRARFPVSDYALGGEAVQEAMFAKLRGIRNFEGRSSLNTWRLSILDNRARSLIEKLLLPT